MAEPTKKQVKRDIYEESQSIPDKTTDTEIQQAEVGAVSEEIGTLGTKMRLSDSMKIMQALAKFRSNDMSAVEELDEYESMFGPSFIDEAKTKLYSAHTAPASFANEVKYGNATLIRDGGLVSDATYTSPEQAQIRDISGETEQKAKQMYAQRQRDLAAWGMPQYQPLSNNPDMNQLYIGLATQAATGLLALVDPEAAALAATEVGSKTIDAMYQRKMEIEKKNKEMYDKYIELMKTHGTRGDNAWKEYFNAVMNERKGLRSSIQKELKDEMLGKIKNNDLKLKALKERIEGLVKMGKMSREDAKLAVDAADKKTKNLNYLYRTMVQEENYSRMMGYRWAALQQMKINTGLEKLHKQAIYSDERVVDDIGANTPYGEMMTANTEEEVAEAYDGEENGPYVISPELNDILNEARYDLENLSPYDIDYDKKIELSIQRVREGFNAFGDTLPDDIQNGGRYRRAGALFYIKTKTGKLLESLYRALDKSVTRQEKAFSETGKSIEKKRQELVRKKDKFLLEFSKARSRSAKKNIVRAYLGEDYVDSVVGELFADPTMTPSDAFDEVNQMNDEEAQ